MLRKRLADRGKKVVLLDRRRPDAGAIASGIQVVTGDINNAAFMAKLIRDEGVDKVAHTVAALAVAARENPPTCVGPASGTGAPGTDPAPCSWPAVKAARSVRAIFEAQSKRDHAFAQFGRPFRQEGQLGNIQNIDCTLVGKKAGA